MNKIPQDERHVLLVDNLRTHSTADMVKLIARANGYPGALAQERRSGSLKDVSRRNEFLMRKDLRVRFAFTPVQCSWLNPIESWFGQLHRHVISRNSVNSLQDLLHNSLQDLQQKIA